MVIQQDKFLLPVDLLFSLIQFACRHEKCTPNYNCLSRIAVRVGKFRPRRERDHDGV